jgi:serine/threonine-protein kinase
MTNSGLAKGKLGYMSMEAIGGKDVDARADIFATGVVMWELLAGRRLFKAQNDYEVIAKIHDSKIKPPSAHRPDVPTELDDIVMKALARDRDQRWASAAAMGKALAAVRRFYNDKVRPEEVVKWRDKLRAESQPLAPRIESDAETTSTRLTTDDMYEGVEPPDEIGEGSRREDYDVPSESQAYDEIAVGDEPPRQKFVEGADTIVSIVSYLDKPARSPTPAPVENPFSSEPDTDAEIPGDS